MNKMKRILAFIGVILLLGLYIATLITAILIPKISSVFFKISVFSTIVIPIMLYAYILIYRVLKERGEK